MRRDAEPTPQQPMRVWPIREQPGNDNPHRLLRRKAEDVILPGPFGRQIGEAGYPHPVRKPPLYSGSDQIRREERKRDRHIDLADAAAPLFAMLSVLAVESPISSSSQRRPRAIEAISVARFSERIGRSFRNSVPSGKSTSRRRVEFAFCHGT